MNSLFSNPKYIGRLMSNIIVATIPALVFIGLSQNATAQPDNLRGVSKDSPRFEFPFTPMPTERHHAAIKAYENATLESLVAIKNDDPLLRDIYSRYALNHLDHRPSYQALLIDMKRRGDAAIDILVDLFKKPNSGSTRGHILGGLHHNLWINHERFLPLARDWYAEIKKVPPGVNYASRNHDRFALMRFFSWAGHTEDEAIMRDLVGPDGGESAEMQDFLKHAPLRTKQAASTLSIQALTPESESAKISATVLPSVATAASQEGPRLVGLITIGLIIAVLVWLALLFKHKRTK